ncbi:MAG: DUF1566 domain-containing protein [Nitrospinales bacterium]
MKPCSKKIPLTRLFIIFFGINVLLIPAFLLPIHAGEADFDWLSDKGGFQAPEYVPPPPPKSKVHLVDNGDGTLTETQTQLMWTQKDSYADLGRCLDWRQSREYVKRLKTGGYEDWRLPSLNELFSIYDNTKESNISMDHDQEYLLALDTRFADGAAYWYWSNDYDETTLTDCCARSLYFVNAMVHTRRFSTCRKGGIRAVRDVK